MARQWMMPGVGIIEEDGEEEYFVPGGGIVTEAATFNDFRQAIINGLYSNDTEPSALTTLKNQLVPSDVVRTSDEVVTINLPPASEYLINKTETVQSRVDKNALILSNSSHYVKSSFDITPLHATLSGTVVSEGDPLESEIVAGSKTIILTLVGGTWEE